MKNQTIQKYVFLSKYSHTFLKFPKIIMTKDAYYFSYDANARHDEKILKLRAELRELKVENGELYLEDCVQLGFVKLEKLDSSLRSE